MKAKDLRRKYIEFFVSKGHKEIKSASLIPENDPTCLFTTAGMHPLVPYLQGARHPAGIRLVDFQKCIRTGDIDEVGDAVHLTFFEMLGNWSLGDYFKNEAIHFSFEFLTGKEWLNIPLERLAFTVFAGDDDAPFDAEAFELWRSLGVPEARIARLPKKDNWWGPAGQTGPCGPDTEMFYWTGDQPAPEVFDPSDKLWVEIWNDVFMQYDKQPDGTFLPLAQRNVDTGMGMERVTARPLAELGRQGSRYDLELLLRNLVSLADALGAAAVSGVGHHELWPGNLLLDADGLVRILNFRPPPDPLAEPVIPSESCPFIRYLSPERLTIGEESVASDVYSLGVIAYELLSGVHPFELCDLGEMIDSQYRNSFVSLARREPSLDAATADLIDRMINGEVGGRPEYPEIQVTFQTALERVIEARNATGLFARLRKYLPSLETTGS